MVDRSVDFYRPTILPDPSLRVLERRGIWGMGGITILAAVLVVAALLRLDHISQDPLSPAEAVIWRDWQKAAVELPGLERRQLLAPVFQLTLNAWGDLFPADWMLRFHSTVWTLFLIVLVFRIGTVYFNPQTGGLGASLLAVSPLLVAASQDIGPATEAAALLTVNLICLVGIVFREGGRARWIVYGLSAILAILVHPLSVWVILVQAFVALLVGAREERRGFYGRMLGYAALIGAFAWGWYWITRPVDPFWQPDWPAAPRPGWTGVARLFGANAFWGARLYPPGWIATLGSVVVIVLPLIVGALTLRHRQARGVAAFFVVCGLAPALLLLLLPARLIGLHADPTDVFVLVIAPLTVWAAVALRMGLQGTTRQVLTILLVGGGLVFTFLSSRVEVGPAWEDLRKEIETIRRKGQPVVESRIRPLADYQHYIGLAGTGLRGMLSLKPADRTVALLEAVHGPWLDPDGAEPLRRVVSAWLKDNCKPRPVVEPGFFTLTEWSEFDPVALRSVVNRSTFLDPETRKELRFVDAFGPYDPGFDVPGMSERVFLTEDGRPGCTLVASRSEWLFEPDVPRDCYHVYVPLHYSGEGDRALLPLIWTLPNGERKKQVVASTTTGFSFLWESTSPGESMKIGVTAPGWRWQPATAQNDDAPPDLLFLGLGLRRHFPYSVDLGTPFDDLSLGAGWHPPEAEGDVHYRATEAVADLTLYLPMAGGIPTTGVLSLRVRQEPPLPFTVEWDGKPAGGESLATLEWKTVSLTLPEAPRPGPHHVVIRSRAPGQNASERSDRIGILVDRIAIR